MLVVSLGTVLFCAARSKNGPMGEGVISNAIKNLVKPSPTQIYFRRDG